MQITLKQTEIVDALKMYVQRQGLSLHGKSVEVTFTASRGNTGLLADMAIEDAGLPDLIQSPLDFKDTLKIVGGSCDKQDSAGVVTGEPAPAPTPEVGEPAPETKAASSLFG